MIRFDGYEEFTPGVVYYQLNKATGEYYRVDRTKIESPVPGTLYYTNEIYSKWDEDRTFVSAWNKYCRAKAVVQQHEPIYRSAEAKLREV
jgi:hypothetical protein